MKGPLYAALEHVEIERGPYGDCYTVVDKVLEGEFEIVEIERGPYGGLLPWC